MYFNILFGPAKQEQITKAYNRGMDGGMQKARRMLFDKIVYVCLIVCIKRAVEVDEMPLYVGSWTGEEPQSGCNW